MKEITQEINAKILALYIGSEVIAPDPREERPTRNGYLTGIHGEYQAEIQFMEDGNVWEEPYYALFDKTTLLVKSLSDITDEDAVQVAKICYPELTNKGRLRISKYGYPNSEWHPNIHEETYLVEIEVLHPILKKWANFSLLQIDIDDGMIINGEFDNTKETYKDSPCDNYIFASDYLRSKGYALPAMDFSVEQLISEGVFKLK